jgi:hypothetical protein
MDISKIELQKENGIYLLTKEAVDIIKNARSLVISYKTINRQRIESDCWLRAWTRSDVFGVSVEIGFDMPINVRAQNDLVDLEFKACVYTIPSYQAKHPILELVKVRTALYFRAKADATTGLLNERGLVEDIIHWQVDNGKKMIEGMFDKHICEPNSSHRLIKQTMLAQPLEAVA